MAISMMLASATLAALSNLCMRHSIDKNGSSRAFLMLQLLFSIFPAILLDDSPLFLEWNFWMINLGLIGGLSLGLFKWSIGKALAKGPSGLTFAIANSASVMPAIFLAYFFGSFIHCPYTSWNCIGSFLVVMGLFWAGYGLSHKTLSLSWFAIALSAFCFQALFLSLIQLQIHLSNGEFNFLHPLFTMKSTNTREFILVVFGVAALLHVLNFGITEKRLPSTNEFLWGGIGGCLNGVCTVLFMLGLTGSSTTQESAMIFPIFSIALIIICNLWGYWLYQEKVQWTSNILCILGLMIGSIQ